MYRVDQETLLPGGLYDQQQQRLSELLKAIRQKKEEEKSTEKRRREIERRENERQTREGEIDGVERQFSGPLLLRTCNPRLMSEVPESTRLQKQWLNLFLCIHIDTGFQHHSAKRRRRQRQKMEGLQAWTWSRVGQSIHEMNLRLQLANNRL